MLFICSTHRLQRRTHISFVNLETRLDYHRASFPYVIGVGHLTVTRYPRLRVCAITGTGGSPDSGAAELDSRLCSMRTAIFRLGDLPGHMEEGMQAAAHRQARHIVI